MQSYMVHKIYKVINNWTFEIYQTKSIYYCTNKMAEELNVRWAFNAKGWKPNADEILVASSLIQPEEKERISRFVFQDDAKSSVIGRLMLRKFVYTYCSIPYEDIRFGRDNHGKPYLMGGEDILAGFNVSHQGDYVVLAGNTKRKIGVDTMKVEPAANKDIPDFFRLMKRQFSNHEWRTILSYPTEMEQISCFYRMWCLKESYVKNVGVGITIPLNEISFSLKTLTLREGEYINDTILYERGALKRDWMFEETLLDKLHVATVSFQVDEDYQYVPVPYDFLTFEELVKEAKPIFSSDIRFRDNFMKKEAKPF